MWYRHDIGNIIGMCAAACIQINRTMLFKGYVIKYSKSNCVNSSITYILLQLPNNHSLIRYCGGMIYNFRSWGIDSNAEMRPTCINCISYWYCFFFIILLRDFNTESCWWPHTRKVDIYARRKCWHYKSSCLYITQLVTASLVLISKRKFLIWRLS